MITNLPLLFVKGNPKSLYKMSVEELENFVPFLVHCSWGHDTVKNVQQPTWWPSTVPYANPLVRPKMSPQDWASQLRDIIKLCYKHHCSDFLLKFCEELAKNPLNTLLYVNNCDSTTSLYLKKTRRLLVTFRNENVMYDRKVNRKCLLPHRLIPPASQVDAYVEPDTVNIYLCDTCDRTFENLHVLQDHESVCSKRGEDPSETIDLSRLSPEPEIIDSGDQKGFLRAFGLLGPAGAAADVSPVKAVGPGNPVVANRSRKRRTLVNGPSNFPFSSPAGRIVNKNRQYSYEAMERQRELLDRYCSALPLPLSASLDSLKWTKHTSRHFPVKYKKPEADWPRVHTFPNQRRKLMLDVDSQLLYLKCKPCKVVMDRWTRRDVSAYDARARTSSSSSSALRGNSVRKKPPKPPIPVPVPAPGPIEVIDLCSDDDDQNENVHPTPDAHEAAALNPEQTNSAAAQDSKSASLREPEQSRPKPLQQCRHNLCTSHLTNVISID